MNKIGFILELKDKLSALPKSEVEERLSFYCEMIEDRIEDGLSEEEAVEEIGTVDEIARQIASEIPLTKIVKENIKPKRKLSTVEIVLLVLGAPLWVSLIVAATSVVASVYVSMWSVIVSLWATDFAIFISGIAATVYGICLLLQGNAASGFAMIGISLSAVGLSVLGYYGCKALTLGTVALTKLIIKGIKRCFVRRDVEK
jgi:uncharacterized membrane protein